MLRNLRDDRRRFRLAGRPENNIRQPQVHLVPASLLRKNDAAGVMPHSAWGPGTRADRRQQFSTALPGRGRNLPQASSFAREFIASMNGVDQCAECKRPVTTCRPGSVLRSVFPGRVLSTLPDMAPPDQDVTLVEHLVGNPPARIIQRHRLKGPALDEPKGPWRSGCQREIGVGLLLARLPFIPTTTRTGPFFFFPAASRHRPSEAPRQTASPRPPPMPSSF
ncbi:MAG: hypothetical protein Ct9H300mP1_35400 [Planctomycetaceae bacterium]|nr:MAG: hypothetical protein Ct9H300mP1_35400 [Planctomycetaceae bacterium]